MTSKLVRQLKRRSARIARAARLSSLANNELAAAFRKDSDGFLLTPEWKALRALAVSRYGCVCCKCGREQSRGYPINIDHIKPRKFFPELALDIDNLQPLCGPCNKRKGNGPAVDYRQHPSPQHQETA